MRHLTGPWNGFGADADMVAYWRFNVSGTFTTGSSIPDNRLWQHTDILSKPLTFIDNGVSSGSDSSLYTSVRADKSFRGTNASVAWRSAEISADFAIFNPIDYPTQYQGGTGEWSIAGWYQALDTTATACFIEYGARIPAGLDFVRLMFSRPTGASVASPVQWYVEASAADGLGDTTRTTTRWLCPSLLPRDGMLAVAARYNYNDGTPHMALDWYHSSYKDLYVGRSTIQAKIPLVTSVSDLRWSINDINQQTSGATISAYSAGMRYCEIAVWPRHLGPTGVRRLYRNCVKPWDDKDVLDTGSRVECRVVLEDGLEKDLTALFEMDYVQEVSISETADDSDTKATIKLSRKKGPLEDLSPLSTTSDFATYIKLRRRLRIERAYVPHQWQLQGWEWETAFVGYVDSWEFDDSSITIACSDQTAVLEDAQILDNRAYNMYTENKSMEAHQQQIITDFLPKSPSGTYYPYKGMSSTGYRIKMSPALYGLAGRESGYSNFTLAFSDRVGVVDADWNLNYNDVSAGSVINAVRAVSDQIGFETRYLYHAPWDYYRLTAYDALRQTTFNSTDYKNVRYQYRIVRRSARVADAEFLEPHGMMVGSIVEIESSTSVDLSWIQEFRVTATTSPYTCVLEPLTADLVVGSGATINQITDAATACLFLKNSYEYTLDNIAEFSPLSANVEDIRNVVDVKFNRTDKSDVLEELDLITVSASQVATIRSPISGRFRTIDPDRNGISLTIGGWFATPATAFNATWSARRHPSSDTAMIINEPMPAIITPGNYLRSNASNASAHFKSPYVLFNEVYSEDATSIAEYGVRQCSVYEGSTLGIDTVAEAQRLSSTIIADLAQPVGDLKITSRITPLDLNDYVKLPVDFKGRYEESHRVMTVTGREERYASGTSEASYTLRVGLKPTRGRNYVGRMLNGFGAPAPAVNMPTNPDLIREFIPWDNIRLIDPGRVGILTANVFQASTAGKTSLRHDQSVIHTSTTSSGFIPTPSTNRGSFRGSLADIKATPGQATYIKMGVKDKFGNLSPINGLGLASAATVYMVVPRFTALTAGAMLFPSAATTERNYSSSTYTPIFMSASSTSFSSRGFDVYNNFVAASLLFQMPCDGTVAVDAEFDVRLNTGSGVFNTRVSKLRLLSGSLVTFGSTAPTSETLSNTTFGTTSRKAYSFMISASSGDYLRFEVADGGGAKTFSIGSPDSSSATAPFLRYTLVSESRHQERGI